MSSFPAYYNTEKIISEFVNFIQKKIFLKYLLLMNDGKFFQIF